MYDNYINYNSIPDFTNDSPDEEQSLDAINLNEDGCLEEITERATDEEESQSIVQYFNSNSKKLLKFNNKDLIKALNKIIKYRSKIYYCFIHWRRVLNTKFVTNYSPKNLKRRKIIPKKFKITNFETKLKHYLDIPTINIFNNKNKSFPKLTKEMKNNLACLILFKENMKKTKRKFFNKWIYSITYDTEKKSAKSYKSKNYRNYLFKLYQKMPKIKTKNESGKKINKTICYRTKEEDIYHINNNLNKILIKLIKKLEYNKKKLSFIKWKNNFMKQNNSSEIFVYDGTTAYNNIEKSGGNFDKNIAINQLKNYLRNKNNNNYNKNLKKKRQNEEYYFMEMNRTYDEEISNIIPPINKNIDIKKLNFDILNKDNQKYPYSSRIYYDEYSNTEQNENIIKLLPCEIIEENIFQKKKNLCNDKKMNVYKKKSKNIKINEKLNSLIHIKNKQLLKILSFYFNRWKINITNLKTLSVPKNIKRGIKLHGSPTLFIKTSNHFRTESEIKKNATINVFEQRINKTDITSLLDEPVKRNYLKSISNNVSIDTTIDNIEQYNNIINNKKTNQIFTRVFHKVRNKIVKKKSNKKLDYVAGTYRLLSIINNFKEKNFNREKELQKYFFRWCVISFSNGVEEKQKEKTIQFQKENKDIKIMKKYLKKWYNITFYNENQLKINGKEKELERESLIPLIDKNNDANGKVKEFKINKAMLIKVKKPIIKKLNNKTKVTLFPKVIKKTDINLYSTNEEKSKYNEIKSYLKDNIFFDNIKDSKETANKNIKIVTKHNSCTDIKKNNIAKILINKIEKQSENGLTIQNIININNISNKLNNNNNLDNFSNNLNNISNDEYNFSQMGKIIIDNNKIIMNNFNSIIKSNKSNLNFPCIDKYTDFLRKNYLSMVSYKIYSLYYLFHENGKKYYLTKYFFRNWKKKSFNSANIKCVEEKDQNENGH